MCFILILYNDKIAVKLLAMLNHLLYWVHGHSIKQTKHGYCKWDRDRLYISIWNIFLPLLYRATVMNLKIVWLVYLLFCVFFITVPSYLKNEYFNVSFNHVPMINCFASNLRRQVHFSFFIISKLSALFFIFFIFERFKLLRISFVTKRVLNWKGSIKIACKGPSTSDVIHFSILFETPTSHHHTF